MPYNESRLKTEIKNLPNNVCTDIHSDLEHGYVGLEGFAFPEGWEPRKARIVFDVPEEYPNKQPLVYLREEMRYHGEKPEIMMNRGPDGWSRHCIHKLHDWNPNRHTLVTILRMVHSSLKSLNSSNPLK
jgi:ubiquitin-protein ligase